MLFLIIYFLLFCDTKQEYIYNKNPVPKADVLDEVLSKVLNRTEYTGSLFSFLSGNDDFGDPDNLDVSILNANNVFKLISKAKKQYEPWFRRTKQESRKKDPRLVERAMDLMRQSIYATRYRMQDTKRARQFYANDARFQMAVLYGSLMQVNLKMETLFAIMRKLTHARTYLIWYVICYEKILAGHVDVHNLVEKIFELHDKQLQINLDDKAKVVLAPTLRTTRATGPSVKWSRGTNKIYYTREVMPWTRDTQHYTDPTPKPIPTKKKKTFIDENGEEVEVESEVEIDKDRDN